MKRPERVWTGLHVRGHLDGPLLEHDPVFVDRQAIERGAVLRCEPFERVERAFFREHFGVRFERERRIEDARAFWASPEYEALKAARIDGGWGRFDVFLVDGLKPHRQ